MRLLAGIILVFFLSPFTLWFGEGVDRVEKLEASSYVEGEVEVLEAVSCPLDSRSCLYVKTLVSTQVDREVISCGELPQNVFVLEQVEDRCSSSGVCESCYRVQKTVYDDEDPVYEFAVVEVDGYQYVPNKDSYFVGLEKEEVRSEGDRVITSYEYLPITDEMLVTKKGSSIDLVSNQNYETTLSQLEADDNASKWALRFGALFFMILGMISLVSHFAVPLFGVLKVVPIFGSVADSSLRVAVYILAGLAGAVLWAVLATIVAVLHNIYLLAAVLVLVLVGGFWAWPKMKDKKKGGKK